MKDTWNGYPEQENLIWNNGERFLKCSCGKQYRIRDWQKLRLVGTQIIPAIPATSKAYQLEYRDCSCKSTITVELP